MLPIMDAAVLTLARLARLLERACTELTLSQYRLLAMIADGAERASQIAGRLALTKPTVSATIDTLAERGLVTRAVADDDRRVRGCRSPPRAAPCSAPPNAGCASSSTTSCSTSRTRGGPGRARRSSATPSTNDGSSAGWPGRAREERLAPTPLAVPRAAQAQGVHRVRRLARDQVITVAHPAHRAIVVDNVITEQSQPLWPLLVLLVGLGAVNFVLAYFRRFRGGRIALDVQHDLRTAIFERAAAPRLRPPRRAADRPARVARRAPTSRWSRGSCSSCRSASGNIVLFVVSLVVMFVLSPLLTLVMLAVVPALLFVSLRLRTSVFPASWDAQQQAGDVANVVDEAVTGVRVVKGFGQEDRELDRPHRRRGGPLRLAGPPREASRPGYQSALQTIPAFGQVGGARPRRLARAPRPDQLGTFLAFSTYMLQLTRAGAAVRRRSSPSASWPAPAPSASSTCSTRPRSSPSSPTRSTRRSTSGEVDFDHVTLRLPRSEPVLRDFSLHVAPGETVALVGSVGFGQVDGRPAAPPLLRRAGRQRSRSTASTCATSPSTRCARRSASCSRTRSSSPTRSAPTSRSAGPTRPTTRSSAAARAPRRTSSSSSCPTATTPSSASGASRSPAASASASRSPGRCSPTRGSCARRRHLVGRRAHRGGDPRHAAPDHGRPHDAAHRPPALDAAPRRPHRGRRRRPGRRERHPRGADGDVARSTACCSGSGRRPRGRRADRHQCRRRPRRCDASTASPRALWDRQRRRAKRCARSSHRRARRWRASGMGGSGASAAASGGGLALAPTPELLAQVDALPPADDDPEVDVAAEAAASERLQAPHVPAAVPPPRSSSASPSSCSTRC